MRMRHLAGGRAGTDRRRGRDCVRGCARRAPPQSRLDAARRVPRLRREPRPRHARAVAVPRGDAGRGRPRRGAPARGRDCRLVDARTPRAPGPRGPGGVARGVLRSGHRAVRGRRRRPARVRGRARLGAAEQHGLPHLSPRPCRRVDAARRHLLDRERAGGGAERLPAVRRAAGLLPHGRDRRRPALRAPAVPLRARDPRLGVRIGTTARLRSSAVHVRRRAHGHVLGGGARGGHRAERSLRGVLPRGRRVPAPRRRSRRGCACGRGSCVRDRDEAHGRARDPDPRLARARARAADVPHRRHRRARRAPHDRDVGLRAERGAHRSHLRRGNGRSAGSREPRLSAKRGECLLPGVRADGHLRSLLPRDRLARAPRRRPGGGRAPLVAPPRTRAGRRRGGLRDRTAVPRAASRGRRSRARRVGRARLGIPDPRARAGSSLRSSRT